MSSSVWAPPCSHDAAHPTWEALAAEEAAGDDQEVSEPKLTSIEFPAHVPVHLAKALRPGPSELWAIQPTMTWLDTSNYLEQAKQQ